MNYSLKSDPVSDPPALPDLNSDLVSIPELGSGLDLDPVPQLIPYS